MPETRSVWRCQRCGDPGPPEGRMLNVFSAKVNDITESHRRVLCSPCLNTVRTAIDRALTVRGLAAL